MAQEGRGQGRRATFSESATRNLALTHRTPLLRRRTGTLPPEVDPKVIPREVPNPSHRHGTPSGPWPFLDLHVLPKPELKEPDKCPHKHPKNEPCWCRYPQSLYPNWTHTQQEKSRITKAIGDSSKWTIYPLAVNRDGIFKPLKRIDSEEWKKSDDSWNNFRFSKEQTNGCRVHALFVDHMAGQVMKILGAKYDIEPFFFSSSFGWIPTQYQESVVQGESDHITITLTFVRCISNLPNTSHAPAISGSAPLAQEDMAIKTNEYLWLESSYQLLSSDIISLHMIRHPKNGNTIISYHAPSEFRATTAKQLHDRFRLTGRSVYWSHIFKRSKDPTFTFLSLLWYALYAWDESLEALYNHLCTLESKVLEENDLDFTQELHRIRAHLLHYASLLEDFKKTVIFVRDTHHPALDNTDYFTPQESQCSKTLMNQECTNLLNQIERLELTRKMQDKRLTNVMQLGFSSVNIADSRRMHQLTEAAVRDSAAMKQIAYLTMVFLPASFVATAFGMNVSEINFGSTPSLSDYFATALPLTAVTIWIVVALQIQIEDKPSRRRRPRNPIRRSEPSPPPPPQISDEIVRSPTATSNPQDHHLRHAHTVLGGEIVLDDDDDDGDDDDKAEEDHDIYNARNNRYTEFKNSSLLKRLAWPISLTHAAYTNWRSDRPKRRKSTTRRTSPQRLETDNVHEGRNFIQSILPTYFTRSHRNGGPMTEAQRCVEDYRSQHSGSKHKSSGSNTSLPRSILRGSERASETVSPVGTEESR
ncbi:hypothetical protein Agabi119p4_10876 [Agaricus bisporus var. burnettii]|uniref:Uncharacterized protein n=1 Tax=Agaricus bisporus var. burnettii TaxID=192524 RepID=A0A8H7C1F3_AGABI|nr:hypothetical protein Agabi119p4_10876 [Agaricus bisporus var. burnettii]